ncbi:MAG: methyltransferase domain-containing protein, partial [Candidatus Eisenbacteria bacterium]|nr:methyltransferase domain-containing protein [Candidatus Eisenbacteria bacterium]
MGHLMAVKNRGRSRMVLEQLDLEPGDRVLEIGFGPGVDLRTVSRRCEWVAGIDHSEEMLRQARRRNLRAIETGGVELRRGTAEALPFDDDSFDKAFSINSVQFWPDLDGGIRELRRVLRPGGRAVLAIQPRQPRANLRIARSWETKLVRETQAAGFSSVRGVL